MIVGCFLLNTSQAAIRSPSLCHGMSSRGSESDIADCKCCWKRNIMMPLVVNVSISQMPSSCHATTHEAASTTLILVNDDQPNTCGVVHLHPCRPCCAMVLNCSKVMVEAKQGLGMCRVTNPHEFTVDGVHMLGTSGQNVDDVAKYSSHQDGLQTLRSCLEWAHLAPTGPDTLTIYPFKNLDPFILNQAPHVMFVGNQSKFQTGWFSGEPPAALVPPPSPTDLLLMAGELQNGGLESSESGLDDDGSIMIRNAQ